MASYTKDIDKLQVRLKRIEGQVRGVQKMLGEERYCVDVLTQLSSIVAATQKVGLIVLEDHIQGCVASSDGDEANFKIEEVMDVIERLVGR